MNWTKVSEKIPSEYIPIVIKWQSKSELSLKFVTTGFFNGEQFVSTSPDELTVTDDLVAVEWMDAK